MTPPRCRSSLVTEGRKGPAGLSSAELPWCHRIYAATYRTLEDTTNYTRI